MPFPLSATAGIAMIPMLDATSKAAQSSRRIPSSITADYHYNADNVRYVK